MPRRFLNLLPFLALALIVQVYFNVTLLGYVWDDRTLFIDSPLLRNPQNLWDSISVSILPGTTYFRPAVLLTFILEFKIFGVSPSVSHTVNLCIFLLNCSLVGLLASRILKAESLFERNIRIMLAILLYGLHPTLLEATAWVAGRFDLLVTTFFLGGLLCSSTLQGLPRYLGLAVCLMLALLSKEMAITFPVVFVLWRWLEHSPELDWRARLTDWLRGETRKQLVIIALVISGYLFVRYLVHPELYAHDSQVDNSSVFVRIAFVGQTLLFYLRMIVWPFADLNPMHPFDPKLMSPIQVGIGDLTIVFAFLLGLYACLRGRRSFLLLLCVLVALMPVLNIIPLIVGGNIGHERFMTLPMAFFALWGAQLTISHEKVSLAMRQLLPWLTRGGMIIWLALCVMNIKVTLPLWLNEGTLWRWAYQKHSGFEFVQFNFVASLISEGKLDEAKSILYEIQLRDGMLDGRMKALQAQILIRERNYSEALELLDDSIKAEILPHLEVIKRSVPLEQAHLVRDTFQNAWFLRFVFGARAEAEIKLGRFKEADSDLQIMGFYDPNYAIVYLFRSFAAYGLNELDRGDLYFERALDLAEKSHGKSIRNTRDSFLKDLCSNNGGSYLVCQRTKNS